jgi:hypothetical protein
VAGRRSRHTVEEERCPRVKIVVQYISTREEVCGMARFPSTLYSFTWREPPGFG